LKIVTIVGARPQFIKSAPVSRELRKENKEILVHTGQHYDDNMSAVFFGELNIPKPDYNLGVGSASHGKQTADMLVSIENVLLDEEPDWVIVYGDTNSTIAGSLAASKLHIPIIHIEAGLRSYNRKMPEEINRVLTDNISTILSCPTKTAVDNLKAEGLKNIYDNGKLLQESDISQLKYDKNNPLVINTGDVMYDAVLYNKKLAEEKSMILNDLDLDEKNYYLATVHRAENTDNRDHLKSIFEKFSQLSKKVVLPIHPRTSNKLKKYNLEKLLDHANIKIIDPIGYLDMLSLISKADRVLTDSGGVQKEAFMLGTPCITLRNETEWVETIEYGKNVLAGLGAKKLDISFEFNDYEIKEFPYGNGDSAKKIVRMLK
jgi:UDP-GlcNAc3NAcA epimerase